MESNSPEIYQTHKIDSKEQLKNPKIGVAIGSGGVYAAAALGVLEKMEQNGLEIPYVGGASGGAIIAALYFLEGNATTAQQKLLEKLPEIGNIKLRSLGKPMPGIQVRQIIENILDGRNWKDGKIKGACFGAAYQDTKETVILTEESGLSLTDCVLASMSLKMIEPIVMLDNRVVAHGGDPDFINGLRAQGADFIIGVAPNLEEGVIGKIAQVANTVSSAVILKGDRLAAQKQKTVKVVADYAIRPNLSLKPLVSPLNFSNRNIRFMIEKGRILAEHVLPNIKKELSQKRS